MNVINGKESWCATYYEVVVGIISMLYVEGSIPSQKQKDQGRGGLYELAHDLTDEFEKKFEGRGWDGEFFDAIDEFLGEKLSSPGGNHEQLSN